MTRSRIIGSYLLSAAAFSGVTVLVGILMGGEFDLVLYGSVCPLLIAAMAVAGGPIPSLLCGMPIVLLPISTAVAIGGAIYKNEDRRAFVVAHILLGIYWIVALITSMMMLGMASSPV